MKSRFFTAVALVLAAGMMVACSQTTRTTYEYAYPHQKRVDTKCWDNYGYGHNAAYAGGYRGTPLLHKIVYFDTGSSRLTAEGVKVAHDVAKAIKKQALCGSKLVIVGHTDGMGGDDANHKLAKMRASAVKKALIGNGISADLLLVKSIGESAPTDTNDTGDGRANNRRVTFEVR
jgi:outer membrane protein OmpA-like peptidoglycan-associated protein